MKKNIFNLMMILLFSFEMWSQNSAPSCHLTANDNAKGDIIMKTVRATITTNTTYYCTMQWNGGRDGGAYCGFQDSPDKGHLFIYSVWDPSNHQAITAKYLGPGTTTETFGGEGTGLKSYNQTIGWTLNQWNTQVTRRWDVGTHTYFGYWIRNVSANKWIHMVTIDYPVAGIYFEGQTNAFLEDWTSTGVNTRRYELKDIFKRKTDGTWLPGAQATFTRNNEARSANYTNANDSGVSGGAYYMQSGGNTTPSYTSPLPLTLSQNPGIQPTNPAIDFSITSATTNEIKWSVPVSSTPQFRYTISVNGTQVATAIGTEVKKVAINAIAGSTVMVVLEDILGRTSSQTAILTEPPLTKTLKTFDSQQIGGNEAKYAIDNNNATFWHTAWTPTIAPLPHYITLDLGANYSINGLKYLPRQDGGTNGMINGYKIYVSTDNVTWGTATTIGTWSGGISEKTATFVAKTGRFVMLVATSEINGQQFTSASEIKIVTTSGTAKSITEEVIKPIEISTATELIYCNNKTIYINPTKDSSVSVFDISGNLIEVRKINSFTDIPISGTGVYIVKVSSIDGIVTKKIVLK